MTIAASLISNYWEAYVLRGLYNPKQNFCLQEDEPITGERGAYNTAVYGMIA